MSQTIGRVRPPKPLHLPITNQMRQSDPFSLLQSLAPRLPLQFRHPTPRPPRLPDRHHSYGEAQTNLGPLHRLRRLRRRHRLHRCVCYGQENAAEAVL